MNLPGMDGIALCKHLAEREDKLPVILISGQPGGRLREPADRAGAFAYLEKPVDGSILDLIRQALATCAAGATA